MIFSQTTQITNKLADYPMNEFAYQDATEKNRRYFMKSLDIFPRSSKRLTKFSEHIPAIIIFICLRNKKSSLKIQTYGLVGVFIFILIALIGHEDAVKRSFFLIISASVWRDRSMSSDSAKNFHLKFNIYAKLNERETEISILADNVVSNILALDNLIRKRNVSKLYKLPSRAATPSNVNEKQTCFSPYFEG